MEVTALLAAAGLAAIDVVYAARGRIHPIYVADAVVEMFFAAAGARVVSRPNRPSEDG
jgi:hypothetical protein